ncbi:translation elongation factor Ts [Microbacter margulisiae]|uniref:Elongation factor Ts n=1 Tax=Microbacter margulisiae TaxID=1350067 RepID=A0A7W5DSE5_9PORP|nr:translation elongation factor Ts [Microbacter margulisiae]MBB3188215.1 elongation factor Ts [Microbacter margulisiae]
MAVTMADISKLRTMTGAGMMDCKNALTESNGDFDKAIEIIRKKGQAVAAKRSDREASEGCVLAGNNGNFAAVLALKCETDFVAKNADFIALTQSILDEALAKQPASKEELLAMAKDGRTVAELITDRSGITGEKMELDRYDFVKGESTIFYIHPGNKLATIVAFAETSVEYQVARDVAMQVAAMNPVSLDRNSVPVEIVEKELEIGRDKARQEGKPEAMLDKIAQGRLNKFYQEFTLVEQEFIKDNKMTIAQYVKQHNATPIAFKRITLNQE